MTHHLDVFWDYIRSVAGASTADELAKLDQLRDSGVLTAEEFAKEKLFT